MKNKRKEVDHEKYGFDKDGEEGECSSTKAERQFNCLVPSPVSVLDPSTSAESCNSTESTASNVTEESKMPCSSVQMDLLDSAASSNWELYYIRETLCDLEFTFNDCASGRTTELINPMLFDQLEMKIGSSKILTKMVKAERKVLFDCVHECLEWRRERFVGGGSKAWSKASTMVSNKEQLTEEIYKEIQVWKRMGDCMVDELVNKDMSVAQGRWLEFEADEFALAVEIEDQILDSLVFEVAAEVLPFNLFKHSAFLWKV